MPGNQGLTATTQITGISGMTVAQLQNILSNVPPSAVIHPQVTAGQRDGHIVVLQVSWPMRDNNVRSNSAEHIGPYGSGTPFGS